MKRRSTLFISLVFFTGCGLSSPADLPDAESGGQTTVGDVPTASTPKVADAAHQGNPTDPASALGRCAKDGFYCLAFCRGFSVYHVVGDLISIPYGDCTAHAQALCARHGRSYIDACWGASY